MASEKSAGLLERPPSGAAFALCALILIAAPLLFGTTDRFFQAILLALFAMGLYLAPPLLWAQGSRIWVAGLILLAGLLLKEFAPAVLFGATDWRTTLTQSYGLKLPWTHHPEPVRAMEAFLSGGMAVLWLLWMRTMAGRYEGALRMVWILIVAGGIVGAVSLFFGHSETSSIYGVREMAGYKGFGPFPNRNHTACLLAMTMVTGAGALMHALRRRRVITSALAMGLMLAAGVALLETRSRGGLLALVTGMGVFGVLLVIRSPSRKAFAVLLAVLLLGLAGFFIFGRPLFERMADVQEVSRDLRWTVWQDARQMWMEAPLFGHGMNTFSEVFPMYQSINSGNILVLHPESSWMLGLDELGWVIVLGGTVALVILLNRALMRMKSGVPGWTLRASAMGAVAVLVVHSIYDVPAHRWATVACGLTALGIACPARGERRRLARAWVLAPLVVGTLWMVPLLTGRPLWSTAALHKSLASNFTSDQVKTETLTKLSGYFPLDPDLAHALGVRRMMAGGRPSETWQRFRVADRLKPSSYLLPVAQAVVAAPVSKQMALYFWSVAIERSEHRAEEFFFLAWARSQAWPGAAGFWKQYAQANPRLLMSYARAAAPGESASLLREWLDRAVRSSGPFEDYELANLYSFLERYGNLVDLDKWMEAHPERQAPDGLRWAKLLAAFGDNARAWKILSASFPEPGFNDGRSDRKAASLEIEWRGEEDNFLKARRLVGALDLEGDTVMRDQVILLMAAKENAPAWFLARTAYINARGGKLREAVAAMLRIPERP